MIDNRDAVFTSLRLWQDKNHNAISEQDELYTLPSLEVTKFELDYHESKRTDEHGNKFKYRAKVWDANKARVGRWAWDVFLISSGNASAETSLLKRFSTSTVFLGFAEFLSDKNKSECKSQMIIN
ncbi:MAG TPA: hypothetical protein VK892_04035 [Pyrinomonadaceae bacterium]|nr:hypothetical protein [Pyrinomonadaceae bacterium]